VVICQDGLITGDDLPERVRLGLYESRAHSVDGAGGNDVDFKELVQQYECRLILDALRACDWNQSEAARRLRIPRRTLVHKMKAYGLRKLGYATPAPGKAGE
jgi:DNA-binding NtrC family response regulator